jgi:hypothetical protein
MVEQFAISHMENSMILARQRKPGPREETRNIPYYVTCDSNRLGGSGEGRAERKLDIGNESAEVMDSKQHREGKDRKKDISVDGRINL